MPAELTLQLGHPRLQRLDYTGLLGVDRPQLHNDRRLDRNRRVNVRIGEQVTASGTSSGHARLPMGLPESYPTPPTQSTRPQGNPKPLNSYP